MHFDSCKKKSKSFVVSVTWNCGFFSVFFFSRNCCVLPSYGASPNTFESKSVSLWMNVPVCAASQAKSTNIKRHPKQERRKTPKREMFNWINWQKGVYSLHSLIYYLLFISLANSFRQTTSKSKQGSYRTIYLRGDFHSPPKDLLLFAKET